jgi:uncharacterized membrane protein
MMVTRSNKPAFPVISLDRRIINEPAVVLLGYVALAFMISLPNQTPLQVWLAIILAILGSGSSTISVFFPRPHDLDIAERVALGACFSMTVGGLLGYALSRSPWGLRVWPFIIAIGLYNLVCFFLTWYRRRSFPENERYIRLDSRQLVRLFKTDSGVISRLITIALIIVFLSGTWILLHNLRVPALDPPMTEFYLLDQSGHTESYPNTGHSGELLNFTYGIVNLEHEAVSYQVKVFVLGEEVGESQLVTLGSTEKHSNEIQVYIPNSPSSVIKVDFILYREAKPYRQLYLWVNVIKP